jgi:hypothetical protein
LSRSYGARVRVTEDRAWVEVVGSVSGATMAESHRSASGCYP